MFNFPIKDRGPENRREEYETFTEPKYFDNLNSLAEFLNKQIPGPTSAAAIIEDIEKCNKAKNDDEHPRFPNGKEFPYYETGAYQGFTIQDTGFDTYVVEFLTKEDMEEMSQVWHKAMGQEKI